MAELAHLTAGRFSAEQRRRLLLLGATARPHEVLLLDAPERALDTEGLATHHPPLLDIADSVLELF